MTLMMKILAVAAVWATPAFAAKDAEMIGGSLLVFLFLGFGALIVVLQLIPSLLLFLSMLKGLFASTGSQPLPKSNTRTS